MKKARDAKRLLDINAKNRTIISQASKSLNNEFRVVKLFVVQPLPKPLRARLPSLPNPIRPPHHKDEKSHGAADEAANEGGRLAKSDRSDTLRHIRSKNSHRKPRGFVPPGVDVGVEVGGGGVEVVARVDVAREEVVDPPPANADDVEALAAAVVDPPPPVVVVEEAPDEEGGGEVVGAVVGGGVEEVATLTNKNKRK